MNSNNSNATNSLNLLLPSGWNCYPWGLARLDEAIRRWQAAGLGQVSLAAAYHTTRALLPDHTSRTLWHIPSGCLHFQPDLVRYKGCWLQPLAADWQVGRDVYGEIRAAAGRAGLAFSAWLVGCHNSRLGEAQPECVVENALGDRFIHSLDPAHPEVQSYLGTLVEDMCRQHDPERLILEAWGYYGYKHAAHHDQSGCRFDWLLDFLYSLSLSPSSMVFMRQEGLDAEAVRLRVARWLRELLRGRPRPRVDSDEEVVSCRINNATN